MSIAAAKDVPDGQGEDTQIEPQRPVVDVAVRSAAARLADSSPLERKRIGSVDPSRLCGIIAPLDALFFEGALFNNMNNR
jgi:hypothetical protein